MAAALAGEGPRAFVERIYAQYHQSNYSPLDRPERVFAPPLTAAIREDARLAHGEVGFLDGDPLCDCQDTGGMQARVTSLSTIGGSASARIFLRFSGTTDTRAIRLRLVRTGRGWRIADVGTHGDPSLLQALTEANRKARKR
jgi:hypothetical protein